MQKEHSLCSFTNFAPLLGMMAVLSVFSYIDYLLFHSLVELISVVVACGIFMLAWNSRGFTKNQYLLFIGIAYLFVGFLDLVHTLSYKGMGVFPGYGANLPTQLWIAARYMESFCLLIAPLFLRIKFRPALLISVFFIVTCTLLWSIFSGIFPDCYLEATGLTPFKKNSEYLISGLLLTAFGVLFQNRSKIAPDIFLCLSVSIFCTIVSELAFTFYVGVFEASNLVGHLFKLISFYLIYKAIIETGLREPYQLLFRDLQQSENRYRSLFDNLLEGFAYHKIVVDEDGRPIDYIFLEVNDAFEQLTGLKKKDICGRRVTEVLPGIRESPFDWIAEYAKVALTGSELKTEQFSEPLNKWFSISAYCPEPGFFVAVFEDITSRKEAEKTRENYLRRLQLMIRFAQNILAAESQKIMLKEMVNAARELTDANLSSIFHDFDESSLIIGAAAGPAELRLNPSGKRINFEGDGLIADLRHRRHISLRLSADELNGYPPDWVGLPDGHVPMHGLIAIRLSSRDEKFWGVLLVSGKIYGDFTEEDEILLTQLASLGTLGLGLIEAQEEAVARAAEAESGRQQLKALTRELERSNSDLEQFAYIASHDLQEPLRSVAGFIQLLSRRYSSQLDSKANEFIDFAVSGTLHMENLLRDLLLFSRVGIESQLLQRVCLQTALDQSLVNLRKAIDESGAEFICGSLPEVNANKMQMIQLFQNLIGNAIKFRGKTTPVVQISAKRELDEWIIAIKDNGIGIDPRQNDRIFLIFQRLHRKGEYQGTGVGLAVCKKIVERHGGRIWVESEPGKGTTFFFSLPAIQDSDHQVESQIDLESP